MSLTALCAVAAVGTRASPSACTPTRTGPRVRRKFHRLAVCFSFPSLLVVRWALCSVGAEEAFKRLSVAYDCLTIASAQREYVVKLQRARGRSSGAATVSPCSSSSQPPVRRHHKRKRAHNAGSPDASNDATATPRPSRQRTPEEIWRQFQQEEEELARREFLAKGFDRVYHEPKRRERPSPSSSPTASPSCEQEEVLATDLDAKATQWATWATHPAKARRVEAQSATPSSGSEAPSAPQRQQGQTPLICCLLCRRKFATHEQLGRHEAQSALHASNVAKAAAEQQCGVGEQQQ